MLNGLTPLTHCLWIGIEAPLHGFEHVLVRRVAIAEPALKKTPRAGDEATINRSDEGRFFYPREPQWMREPVPLGTECGAPIVRYFGHDAKGANHVTDIIALCFSCKGRLSRADFHKSILWLMLAFAVLTSVSLDPFSAIIFNKFPPVSVVTAMRGALFPAGFLTLLVVWYVLAIKRAHDLGRTAAWVFLVPNPFSLLFSQGDPGPNRYGPSPEPVRQPVPTSASMGEKAVIGVVRLSVPSTARSDQEKATIVVMAVVGVALMLSHFGRPNLIGTLIGLAILARAVVLWRRWFSERGRH